MELELQLENDGLEQKNQRMRDQVREDNPKLGAPVG
jgi:hypothetical protein